MATRTNWHTVAPQVDTDDPFEGIEVEQPGEMWPIIEHAPENEPVVPPDLAQRFRELLYREGRLAEEGIRCSIKDRPDTCCSACPLRGTARAGNRVKLCTVGCLQEETFMAMVSADAACA